MDKLLVICGPTASGKTALGVALARRFDGEVVSADSMQIYRGMDIGTAKPTAEEMQGIPHHMIDVADPGENFSAARYADMAASCVEDIRARGKLPIVVGGTGLYIDALVSGRDFAAFTGERRAELEERASREGIEALYRELSEVDPERAAKLHLADRKRIIRALEVYYETGETITAHDARTKEAPPRYDALRIALNYAERAELRRRIDARVDEMMAAGLPDEVRRLLASGISPETTAMQAIGYKECAAAVRGESDWQSAAGEVKLRSRQYAKRQETWFRRTPGVRWILWEGKPELSQAVRRSTDFMAEYGLG